MTGKIDDSGARGAALLLLTLLAACAGRAENAENTYAPAPGSYFTIAVQPDDSLASIAQLYEVTEDDLRALNAMSGRDSMIAGVTLRIPAYGRLREVKELAVARPAAVIRSEPAVTHSELPPPDQTPAPRSSSVRSSAVVPIPRPRPALTPARTATPPWLDKEWFQAFTRQPDPKSPLDAPRLLWPVKGHVISSFGPMPQGLRNDGINISVERGAPVLASAAGTVTYVGNELKGYGNLVLIRHDDGYITAYAHADAIAVSRGDRVERGQIIAYAGSSGDVSEPQLHFELRRGTKPVDPQPYLAASN